METFKHLYLNVCKEMRASPDDMVLSSIETDEASTALDLSNHPLSEITCDILGRAFAKDIHLTYLDFSDCILQEEGLIDILRGLQSNKTVISLNLRGNRIKSSGAQVLGRFLRLNTCLVKLNLEWNSIGVIPEKFFVFCDGLTLNQSLKELNLGHNGLRYKCASVLAEALYRNKILENLILCWNDINYIGGQSLLKALNKNKQLTYIDVTGNQIPGDIEYAIGLAVFHNRELQENCYKHTEEARALINKLQELEKQKNEEVDLLLEKLKKEQQNLSNEQRKNELIMANAQKEISEKNSAMEVLTSKCQELRTKLISTEAKQGDLIITLGKRDDEFSQFRSQHQSILRNERQERLKAEENFQNEIQTLKRDILNKCHQIEDYVQKHKNQEKVIQRLKDTISHLECEAKTSTSSFGDHVGSLNDKYSEMLKEIEGLRQKDMERLKVEQSETKQHYEQRMKNFWSQKMELEKEIEDLKGIITAEKSQHKEALEELRNQAEAEENKLKNQLKEKVDFIHATKKKNEELIKGQLEIMQEVQNKTMVLGQDIEAKSLEALKLRQRLAEAEEERKLEVANVKLAVKKQLEELEKLKKEEQEWDVERKEIIKKAEETQILHRQELSYKDETITNLKFELEKSEAKIQKLLDEEFKRSSQLETAFMSYFKGVNHSPTDIP